jgi:hypothetical protein
MPQGGLPRGDSCAPDDPTVAPDLTIAAATLRLSILD